MNTSGQGEFFGRNRKEELHHIPILSPFVLLHFMEFKNDQITTPLDVRSEMEEINDAVVSRASREST